MTVWILSEDEQKDIVSLYQTQAVSQKQLANHFNCSTGTIRKVLVSKGVTLARRTNVHISTARLIAFAEEHNITVVTLHQLIFGGTDNDSHAHA